LSFAVRRRPSLLIVDGPALSRFARAGAGEALLAWAGQRLHVVSDVYQELAHSHLRLADVDRSLQYLEANRRLLELSQPGRVWAARLGAILGPSWIGTLATARMTRELEGRNQVAAALVDSRQAAWLCSRQGVDSVSAPDLVRYLIEHHQQSIPLEDAHRFA
jgi:hypothetical protein